MHFRKPIRVLTFLLLLVFSLKVNARPLEKHINRILDNELARYHSGELLYNTYKERGFSQIWSEPEKIDSLIKAFKLSVFDGLSPEDYALTKILQANSQRKNREEAAYFDILLTDNYILLLYHLNYGKLNPRIIDPNWQIGIDTNGIGNLLHMGLEKDVLYSLAKIEQSKGYLQLQQQLIRYLGEFREKEYPRIIPGALLKPGMRDSQVPGLRRYFSVYNPEYRPTVQDTSTLYDTLLLNEVIRFQQLHGLRTDGIIGNETYRQLGVTINERMQQVAVNMERLRWLPDKFGDYYLLINIADYRLQLVRCDSVISSFKIIVGTPYRMTPVFTSQMESIVFNPAWIVPKTIVSEDIIPNALKDSLYLEKHGFTVYRNKTEVPANGIDWDPDSVLNYAFMMKTGVNNPLGTVKFIFPNEYDVYIHDTPARDLFNRTDRTYSSGCIRVEKPLELSGLLLNDPENYSKEKIDKIVASGKYKNIVLTEKPVVILLYQTAWVDPNGNLNFRKDIYERDLLIGKALGFTPTGMILPGSQ